MVFALGSTKLEYKISTYYKNMFLSFHDIYHTQYHLIIF